VPVKVAVVTGGSSGIGAALARALSGRGWHCILLARGRERLERVAAELNAEFEQCDVSDREQVERVARRIGATHPAVHLLVNNAGVSERRDLLELPPERIEEVVRINYLGSVWCLRAFLPLLETGAPSDVVNVVSVAGTISYGSGGAYAASKHAQLAFSRRVAVELAPKRIRVHTINPGPVPTPSFPQGRLLRHALARHWVLSPEEVAEAIVRSVERGRAEIVRPRSLRMVGVAQSLAPATIARVMAHWSRPE
jgi:NAD(P)-dependent dehydrogenase (short-subunit alcohol dehydrogenase family)